MQQRKGEKHPEFQNYSVRQLDHSSDKGILIFLCGELIKTLCDTICHLTFPLWDIQIDMSTDFVCLFYSYRLNNKSAERKLMTTVYTKWFSSINKHYLTFIVVLCLLIILFLFCTEIFS